MDKIAFKQLQTAFSVKSTTSDIAKCHILQFCWLDKPLLIQRWRGKDKFYPKHSD